MARIVRASAILSRLRSGISRRMTIRARLTFWYVFLLAVILVFFSAILCIRMAITSYQGIQSILTAHSQEIMAEVEIENGSLKWSEPAVPVGTGAVLYDHDGSLIKAVGFVPSDFMSLSASQPSLYGEMRSSGKTAQSLSSYPLKVKSWLENQMIHWMQSQTGQAFLLIDSHEQDWLSLTLPVQENGHLWGYLQVMRPLEPLEQTLQQLLLIFATLIPLTLLAAVAMGMFLAQRALSPINRIVSTARTIGQGNLSQRINWQGPGDELGQLALTFDEMLDRLEESFERQRQFTADASHELRTPITIIRAQAETALNRSRTADDYRETLRQIIQEADRMSHLTGQLLMLARADAGKESLEKEPCDLIELVQAVCAEMQEAAKSKGISIQISLDPGRETFVINGDQTRLTQLVINLLDNAIKYTPAAKPGYQPRVEVRLVRQDNWAVLSVSDNGIGIPPSDLPHIFQRFYRVDKARSRQSGGTGLGLSIAQWIAQSHGGRIEVSSHPGQGSTFSVFLPIAPSAM